MQDNFEDKYIVSARQFEEADFSTNILSAVDLLYSFRKTAKEGRVRKGYLVALYDPPFGITFPINPQTITSSQKMNFSVTDKLGQMSPDMLWLGNDTREISFSLILDGYATDFLVVENQADFDAMKKTEHGTARKGLERTLAQLELFSYPGNWMIEDNNILSINDYFAPPRALFGYGDYMYLEVFVSTNIEITETNKNLEPLRALVDINLKVIDESVSYINRLHIAQKIRKALTPELPGIQKIYEFYLKQREQEFGTKEEEKVTDIIIQSNTTQQNTTQSNRANDDLEITDAEGSADVTQTQDNNLSTTSASTRDVVNLIQTDEDFIARRLREAYR